QRPSPNSAGVENGRSAEGCGNGTSLGWTGRLGMVVVVVVVVVDVLVVVDVARDEIVAAVVGVVAVFEVLGPDVAPVEHAARSAAIVPTVTGNRRKEGRG